MRETRQNEVGEKGRREGGVEDVDFQNLAFMAECFWDTRYFGALIR